MVEVGTAVGGARRGGLWLVLAMALMAYLVTAKGFLQISDTAYSVMTARSIVAGRLDIDDDDDLYVLRAPDGRLYSKYGIGLAVYLVPFVAAADAMAPRVGRPSVELAGFLISLGNLPLALLTLAMFGRLLRLLGGTGPSSTLLTTGLGLGTLCWYYADSDFSEAMQMALLTTAAWGVVRGDARSALVGGLAFGYLLLVKLSSGAYLPLFPIYLLASPGRSARGRLRLVAAFLAPVAGSLAAIAWLNYARFGNPAESGYGPEAGAFIFSQIPRTVPRLLGGLGKGLFVFCPVLILGVLGFPGFARSRPREAALFAAIVAIALAMNGAWHAWEGGYCWGPRLLVPSIPFWLAPAIAWLDDRRSPRRFVAAAAIVAASALVQVPGLLVRNSEYHVVRTMLSPEDQARMLADYPGALALLRHKLAGGDEVYRASEFGVPTVRDLDLTPYRTFRGIDILSEHVARLLGKPPIRLLPLAWLLALAALLARLARTLRAEVRSWAADGPARWTGRPDPGPEDVPALRRPYPGA